MNNDSTRSGTYVLASTNQIEHLTQDKTAMFEKLWIYPGLFNPGTGKLTANQATIYVGEDAGILVTPDTLGINDPPLEYRPPQGKKALLYDVILQGTTGDGVYFKFW